LQGEQAQIGRETLDALKVLVIKMTHLNIAPAEIGDHANLFDDCGLDSTSVVSFVFEIQDAFGIEVAEEEMDAELFQDISQLSQFVDMKRTAKDRPV